MADAGRIRPRPALVGSDASARRRRIGAQARATARRGRARRVESWRTTGA